MMRSLPLLTILIAVLLIIPVAGCGDQKADDSQNSMDSIKESLIQSDLSPAAMYGIETGLRDELRASVKDDVGADAEELFAQMDEARFALLARTQTKLTQPGGQPVAQAGASRQLPSGNRLASTRLMKQKTPGMVGVFGGMAAAVAVPGTIPEGNSSIEDKQENGPVSCKVKIETTKSGSKIVADVEANCSASGGAGASYSEKAKGRIEIDICPDAQGNVPVRFNYENSVDASGPKGRAAAQINMSGAATGHVNDEAALTGMDYDGTASIAGQGAASGSGDGDGGRYAEYHTAVSLGGMERGADPAGMTATGTSGPVRSSSNADSQYIESAKDATEQRLLTLIWLFLAQAEGQWTSGYCVEVVVSGVDDSNEVEKSETKQFQGKVRHKFEGTELKVFGLQGALTGEKELKPTEKKETPVSYTYKAPDEEDKTATVRLETRSKRGAAEKSITFRTKKKKSYTAAGGAHITLSGTICSLESPFQLSGSGQNGIAYSYNFAPSSEKGGSMTYTGSGEGCTESGSGSYTVSLSEDGDTGTITYNVSGNLTCPEISTGISGSETFQLAKRDPCQ